MCQNGFGNPCPCGEAGLEEVAAGWGFPVDHFSGAVDAWEFFEHEVLVKLGPFYTAGAGDDFIYGAGLGERDGEFFYGVGEFFDGKAFFCGEVMF